MPWKRYAKPTWCRNAVDFGGGGNPKFGHDRKPTSGPECRFFSPFSASNGNAGHARLVDSTTLKNNVVSCLGGFQLSLVSHDVEVLLRMKLVRINKKYSRGCDKRSFASLKAGLDYNRNWRSPMLIIKNIHEDSVFESSSREYPATPQPILCLDCQCPSNSIPSRRSPAITSCMPFITAPTMTSSFVKVMYSP